MDSDQSSGEHVSIGPDRIQLLSVVYKEYFRDYDKVRLGVHQSLPLIYIQPVADYSSQMTYSISHRRYRGVVSCKTFLQHHNYHHTEFQRYRAHWVAAVDAVVVDLSDPVTDQTGTHG